MRSYWNTRRVLSENGCVNESFLVNFISKNGEVNKEERYSEHLAVQYIKVERGLNTHNESQPGHAFADSDIKQGRISEILHDAVTVPPFNTAHVSRPSKCHHFLGTLLTPRYCGIVVGISDLCDDVLMLSVTSSKSLVPRNFGLLMLSEFLLINVLIDEIDMLLRHTHTGLEPSDIGYFTH